MPPRYFQIEHENMKTKSHRPIVASRAYPEVWVKIAKKLKKWGGAGELWGGAKKFFWKKPQNYAKKSHTKY